MLQHGAAPDEIDVLLGKQILSQKMDERTQPFALPSRQYDSTERTAGAEIEPVKRENFFSSVL
jgi:hypothetical protein